MWLCPGSVVGFGCPIVRAVVGSPETPLVCVRRCRVCEFQRAAIIEFDLGYAHIVTGAGGDGNSLRIGVCRGCVGQTNRRGSGVWRIVRRVDAGQCRIVPGRVAAAGVHRVRAAGKRDRATPTRRPVAVCHAPLLTRTSTDATPTLSAAVPATVIVALLVVLPVAGLLIVMVGMVVSGGVNVVVHA